MKRTIKFTILATLLLILLAGCDLAEKLSTQSIRQCMNGFIAAAESGNYGACANYIHPDSSDRSGGSTFFEGIYSGASFGDPSYNGSTATVTVNYNIIGERIETFNFRQDGEDYWLIYSFTRFQD